jgi:hypothetical protein
MCRTKQGLSGSYTAVPLVGNKGEVLGLLGVDLLQMTAEGGERGVLMCLYEGMEAMRRCWVCLGWTCYK